MSVAAQLKPGEVFARRYEIQQLLGEGDRKRTYRARDRKMDRLVAISIVKTDAVDADPEGTEREAKVLGRIGSHANVVSLFDFNIGRGGSGHYMVFEYLSGGTLAGCLRERGQLPLEDVLRLGRQLCRGLAHLHRQGLIHRDVSPDNVWLDERQVAHLGDFDSAIPAGSAAGKRPVTTNRFASPEETSGEHLDSRSDLYSLGGVLYVAATGGAGPGDIESLRGERPDLPSAFADLLADLTAHSPADRPSDAEKVLNRLNEIRQVSNIEALIASGESDGIEFKSSLHHPHGPLPPELESQLTQGKVQLAQLQKDLRKELNKAVTKTIAAFLNTSGGTLLVGIADDGEALGIEPDFQYCQKGKHNADGWMLSLNTVVINALGAEVWSAIRVSLMPHQQKLVAVILCPRRPGPTWHGESGREAFYIRAGNATKELDGRSLVRYISERWPT